MKQNRLLIPMLAVATAILGGLTYTCAGGPDVTTTAMLGKWKGSAQIIVAWCGQKSLPVECEIHRDGRVTGKIGDATLKDGRLKTNRGWLGKKLQVKTDYIVTGTLEGAIVAAEGVRRSSVKIPLNFDGTMFTGGLGTSGNKFGGKASGPLKAASLRLERAD